MNLSKNIYIGTSGWSYPDWKNSFYPPKLPTNKWLNYFASQLQTLEVNTTFYHTPKENIVSNWYSQVPDDFVFAIKASGYITHRKRLNDCKEPLLFFYKSLEHLQNKVGPILFQLPPSFKCNLERLIEFIENIDNSYRGVFEFRHESWFTEEVYKVLEDNNIALCITDLNGKLSPEVLTTDFAYVRLHGPEKAYKGSYGTKALNQWKRKLEKWAAMGITSYCYFDNDEKGYAVQDALLLSRSLT